MARPLSLVPGVLLCITVGLFSLLAAADKPPSNITDDTFRLIEQGDSEAPLVAALEAVHTNQSAALRLQTVARWFLGIPYKLDPLGEAAGFDPDPVYSWKSVDCVTMIEIALGFVFGPTPEEAKATTLDLRYQLGKPIWKRRNHLTLAQWIPAAKKKKLLVDITRSIAGNTAKDDSKMLLKRSNCRGRWKKFCQRMDQYFPEGKHSFTYWPLKSATRGVEDIPVGTIMFFLHTPRRALPYQVYHVGVVAKDVLGRTTLIHAAKNPGKVVEVNLKKYLESIPKRHVKWPVLGVMLFAPMD